MTTPADLTILEHIARFTERFVFLKNRVLYSLIAAWVVNTYLHPKFEYTGYLFAHSPEPQSGKSRLLEVLDLLVFNSSGVLVSPTEAVLFRSAKGMTQLLDEADGWDNRDSLRSVLNAGARNGGKVFRLEPDGKGGHRLIDFPVYGPRGLAGVGFGVLDATTRDRTFTIAMVRQAPAERRERLRVRQVKPEAAALKKEIEAWVSACGAQVVGRYDRGEFPYLERFRDRTIDVAAPLAAIVETAYEGHPRRQQAILDIVAAIATTRKEDDAFVTEHRILLELIRLASEEDPLVGTASELASRCSGLAEKPLEYTISETLRRYGFETKSVRKDGMPKYRYVLPHKELAEIFSRYACSTESPSVVADSTEATTPQKTENRSS